MTLSGWASPRAHRALAETDDVVTRLAIALGPIRSVIRVIDRTVPPLTVDWAKVGDESSPVRSMSYTDLRGGHIRINPLPIWDGRLDHGKALDVCIGFGAHEASHSQESRDRFEYLLKKESIGSGASREVPAFEPMRIAAYLWNVVEDVRIESRTSADWPGFAPYFGAVLDYVWDDLRSRHELPVKYGPDLVAKLRVAFLACRFPEKAATLHARVQPEIAWWSAWQHDYLTDTVDTPTTIQRGLDHLAEDRATKGEMEQLAKAERDERERNEKVRAQLERLIREGIKGTYEVCVTENGDFRQISEGMAEEIDQLVAEGLIEVGPIVITPGAKHPPIRVRRPTETAESQRSFIGRPDPSLHALRTALVFRNAAPRHDVKLLKSGVLDDDELYRWGMGDHRVFSERVIDSKPDVFMSLLVDLSGSMRGEKLRIAQQLAQLFVWAVHDQEGVETEVWGHTGDVDSVASEVYRIWQRGDPMSRLGLIAKLPHSQNYDGVALSYVAKSVSEREQPQKIVFVLSDGLPAGRDYGGQPAAAHVRHVVEWARTRGVTVWQIAIDPDGVRPEEQAAMYPNAWIPFTDTASLPRQLTRLMSRYL